MHDELGFVHEHEGLAEEDYDAVRRAILEHDTLELLTVGVDIGSSTTHLLFARVLFERRGHRNTDQFLVVERTVEWRSPILLTPFRSDGSIDAVRIASFVRDCYYDAGYAPSEVDSGAVILTGEAIKKHNARAIDEMVAGESGRFVCATAGHRLECVLAAHGSGATAVNRRRGGRGLHVDIGGGTTKLAVIEGGDVIGVAAFAVGGRIVARDEAGSWSRVDDPARIVAADLGLVPGAQTFADPSARHAVAERLAGLLTDQILTGPVDDLGRALELTEPLRRDAPIDYLTFSGGVSEYLFGHEAGDFGDLAGDLAHALAHELGHRVSIPSIDPGQRIRATVIGASQFSVQVSGKTVHLGGTSALPVSNVPVVGLPTSLADDVEPAALAATIAERARAHDVDLGAPVAIALSWAGAASYAPLLALARGVADAARGGDGLLVLVVDADIAQALGALLVDEAHLRRPLVVLDSIELQDLDYLDVGELLDPPGVVPVVIKSLLFA
ncbi:ethanolamine ammonia-lyase reactivating factor EutA [uncultured Jatrophihabitans sp.]|uniref:ethanolamine ammonia-lyase reactivating factor EutA n=1 Tax=uncultured Jatrophihabitans sp. TaxID=1610747 RepID=UPI0035CAD14E